MSYIKDRKLRRRRHPTQPVTGAEAVARLNAVVDEANEKIAHALSAAQHWEQVATDLAAENGRLWAALRAIKRARPWAMPGGLWGAVKKERKLKATSNYSQEEIRKRLKIVFDLILNFEPEKEPEKDDDQKESNSAG